MSELQLIDLTKRQAEIADWLMGVNWIEYWNDEERGSEAICEYERKYDKPVLKDGRMAIPPSDTFIRHVSQELDKYKQEALDAGQLDNSQQDQGLRRVCKNLLQKMREVEN